MALKGLVGLEPLRFGVVAVLGLGVDLSLAYSLTVSLGLPLSFAAALGFSAGAAFNYLLHEVWTFQDGPRKVSAGRAGRYFAALGVTLAVRLATVSLLSVLFPAKGMELIILASATGVSFAVNYAVSKLIVFRPVTAGRKLGAASMMKGDSE